ncbi:AMP-binding protein, partial [Pseudoalteromonas sp. McH1-42]|uniref:AMP-binding protein n=1 Tax=Pseudoalteromonas sp. McH1-42 TaxID=2917752 RepID=UPI001EF74642
SAQERTNYPFNLSVNDYGAAHVFSLDLQIDEQVEISRIAEYVITALSQLTDTTQTQSVSSLSVLPADEVARLLTQGQRSLGYDDTACIHHLFEQQAAAAPEATALVFQNQSISYAELNQRANQLAHYLLSEQHITSGTLIGVCSSRSVEMVVSILAILKAGGAYVPLDPNYPASRLSYMAVDAGLKQVIGYGSGLAVAQSLMSEQAGTAIDIAALTLDDYPLHNPALHRAVQRLISTPHFMTLDSNTVFLHSANIAFDAATIELWGPLLNGGRCVLYPQNQLDIHALNTLIDSQAINSMWLTAGLFSEWSHHCDGRTSLRYVLAGGDIVHGADVMRVQQALPQAQVINGYGPTENTTFSCCYAIPTLHQSQDIAIGTPLNGDQALVLSDDLSLVPYGSVGELCVGGDGLAQGYLNQPELTAERFIDNPFYDPEVAGSAKRL